MRKVKRQAAGQKQLPAHTYIQQLTSRIYKEFLQIKKKKTTQLKIGKRLYQLTFSKL